MIERTLKQTVFKNLKSGVVSAIFGARRTGKTVLMQVLADLLNEKKVLMLNGEDYDAAALLSSGKQSTLNDLVRGYDYLFVDEAQGIPNIGLNLKLLVDTNPQISVLVTGSSSFDLQTRIGEPLTGRSRFWQLYPLTLEEVADDLISVVRILPSLLVFGSYPQVFLAENTTEKKHHLESIRNGYLLKDVLQIDNVKDSLFIMSLLRSVALQIGNDVSLNELASSLNTTVKTVQRYLELLEKAFIIFRLFGFSRNLRKEISKTPRFYFWDNGIRNAVLSRFDHFDLRDDKGQLFENFCIAERVKKCKYAQTFSNHYFWRTYDRQEIDLIEETDGRLSAFEFKWGKKKVNTPRAFANKYPEATYRVIQPGDIFDFLVK